MPSNPQSDPTPFGAEQKDIFYAAIQRSRMPMLLTDPCQPDNPIVFHNEAFLKLTGYSSQEILGRNCRFLQGPDTNREVIAELRECIAKKTDCTFEILNYRKDGTSFWNALYVSPVFNNEGEVVYFFASQLDITRRVKSEELLRQTQKLETLGQLTGGIAHDFNNMLTVIMANIKMAQAKGIDSPHLDRALAAARSSDKLTQQLLSFARKQRMTVENVNLYELAEHVQSMFEHLVPSGIGVSCEGTSDPWRVELDRQHAENAILNVLLNARDAMPDGGEIVIRTTNLKVEHDGVGPDLEKGCYVVLTVEDSGIGMAEEIRQRVFEPFFTTKKPGTGTGMGMAMVHGFADQSGAKIAIDSTPGRGTKISFYFQAADEHETEGEATNIAPRVMVVEDNDFLRETAVEFLRMKGFTVRHADSGPAALEILENGYVPEVLFSDIIMPGSIDGLGMAKLVRERYPQVSIVMTSGWTNGQDNHGFEVVPKPYDLEKISEMVLSLMRNKSDTPHEG